MMFDWFKKYECQGCDNHAAPYSPPASTTEVTISPSSPARVLAQSLTDPETRSEWERTAKGPAVGIADYGQPYDGRYYRYSNERRDIHLTRYWGYGGSQITTPFTLSAQETKIVIDALDRFDTHLREVREQKVLARLIGEGTPTRSAETTGSVPEGDGGPCGAADAPNTGSIS